MKKPCLFFDLDDTILDFHWAEHRALSRAFREAGIEPEQTLLDRYSDINRRQWELLERGLLTREQVLVRRFQLLFEEQGISAADTRNCWETGTVFSPGRRKYCGSCRERRGSFWPPTAVTPSRRPGSRAPASRPFLKTCSFPS